MNKEHEIMGKKPYHTPAVSTFGTIREITQAVAMNTNRDGGTGQTNKTA